MLWATVAAASTPLVLLVSTGRLSIRTTPPTVCQVSSESYFGVFRFPAQDKGRLEDHQHVRRQWHRRWASTFVATCSSHVHIAKPGSLTISGFSWCQWSCPGGSSDAVDVTDAADKVQLTSSDETSGQMYPLTRSKGTLCVVCCHAHEFHANSEQILVQMRRSLWETCVCFQWCMGRLWCFSMYTVHLSINILFSLARQQLAANAPVMLNSVRMMTSIQLTGSILSHSLPFFAPASYALVEAASVAESSSRNVMVKVVANSVAWSRRVFASSIARRICTSADEFNRESSLDEKKKSNDEKKKGSNDEKKKKSLFAPFFPSFGSFFHQKCAFGVLIGF